MANVIVHIVGGDHEDETSICSARQEIIDEIDQATHRETNSTEKRSGPVNCSPCTKTTETRAPKGLDEDTHLKLAWG